MIIIVDFRRYWGGENGIQKGPAQPLEPDELRAEEARLASNGVIWEEDDFIEPKPDEHPG